MIVDTNLHLGHWPFRHHGWEETPRFFEKLRAAKISQAWVASFEGVLHKDLAGVNSRLAQACRKQDKDVLIPFGVVNPRQPDWEEDLRRCKELHQMPGIRLYPGNHGYKLDDPVFLQLLRLATEAKLLVQIVVKMEDERTRHPLLAGPPVDLVPIARVLPQVPGARLQLLNVMLDPRSEALIPLVRSGQVYVEFAMLEGVGGLARLIDRVGVERVLFGSHFPLYHLESALLKVKESALPEASAKLVMQENARNFLALGT